MRSTKRIYDERYEVSRAMKQLSQRALTEHRGFTEAEDKQAKFLKQRMEELTVEYNLAKAESRRGAIVVKEERGNKHMINDNELELRKIVDTGASDDVIPVGIAKEIIKKVTENSNVIDEMNIVQYQGELKIARENEAQEALLLSETEEIPDTELANRETVTLRDKRVGSLIKISKSTIDNCPSLAVEHLINVLSRRLGRTLDKMSFKADGLNNNMTSGILKDGQKLTEDEINVDALISMVTDMEEVYLQKSKWYMTRELYQQVCKLKFEDGRPVLFMDMRNDRPTPVLFGLPVVISEYAEKICLVNAPMALTLKVSPEFGQITILKEKFITEGCYGFMISAYGDIAVSNPAATRVLEVA
mgnify:FL=1